MKSNSDQTFVVLGIVLLLVVAVGLYLVLRPSSDAVNGVGTQMNLTPTTATPAQPETSASPISTTSGGFELSEAQVNALVALGIDPDAVPASISAEQELCFIEALGEARVAEIKGGAVPNALEFLEARGCL